MRRPSFTGAIAASILATAATAGAQAPPSNGGAPVTSTSTASQRAGERCPPGRWYTEGGNAAHNAASDEAPLLRRPVVAWRQELPGTLLGEPLVWGEHVVLALRLGPNRTAIEARRLHDGAVVGQRALNSATDPAPSLWGNEVVWRVGAGGLELLRIGKASVDFVERMPAAKVGVDAPLRVGTAVYAVVDGTLTCMRASDFRVLWQAVRRDCRGQVAVAGDVVYAVGSAADGSPVITAVDRATGRELAASAPAPASVTTDAVRLQLAGRQLFARVAAGHAFPTLRAAAALNAIELPLPLIADAAPQPIALPVARALDPRVQVAAIDTGKGTSLGLFRDGKDDGVRLDTCELHRALGAVPPTLARDVVYFGACAVDTNELRMLWRIERDVNGPLPAARAIPAARTLLLGRERVLVALREPSSPDPVGSELAAWQAGHERERLVPLVEEALRARDAELAGDLLARARELAADEAWAQKRDKELSALRKDTKAKPDAAKAPAARTKADALAAQVLDAVQRHVAGWTPPRPPADQRRGYRFVLDQAPEHAGTLAAVRALLPPGLDPGSPLHGRDWLDWLDAAAHTAVSFLDAAPGDFARDDVDAITAQEKQQLLEWRSRWRPDLIALRSERLVLFSPIAQPGSLAKALATGELVCDALEAMFAGMPAVRKEPRRMLVFVYPDRAEYLAEAKKLGIDAEWTGGFYSDSLNELVAKSRLYVPADDTGFATVLPTLAHELTHHWLNDRCPAFVPDPVAARTGPKAFWIVEGFASLVEQFDFDVVGRTFVLGRGNLERADLVASATAAQLLDWDRVVATTRLAFDRMRVARKAVGVPSRTRMGTSFQARAVDLFYAQAAMLARYLYDAEDGRHRGALLRYVAAYYTGDADALDFERAFGTTAAALGPKVVEYSRALGP